AHTSGAHRAGEFKAGSPWNDYVLYAEYTGTGNFDVPAVYGRSVPQDGHASGGYFVGGQEGVHGEVFPTGNLAYAGVFGKADGGSGDNSGVAGHAEGTGTNKGVAGLAFGTGTNYGVYGWADNGTTNYAGYFEGDVYVDEKLRVGDNLYQFGKQRTQNGVFEYVYSESGNLDGSGDVTVLVPDRLYIGNDNIVFTYEVWISIAYDEPWAHYDRGAGYLRGQAWKERGTGVSGYTAETSYYRGTAVSIVPGTYSGNLTQFVINTNAGGETYKFTVKGTSGGH
ncbi:MAG: hypothetical protein K8R53_10430, partial [Bacteroidales bacterium]|nr:hypothetical protein [Bacteroidales bacterium]